MNKTSEEYFMLRAEARTKKLHGSLDSYVVDINKAYKKAINDINEDIKKMIDRFSINESITSEQAFEMLNTKLTNDEIMKLKEQVKLIKDEKVRKKLLTQINSQAYRARITIKEGIKQDIQIKMNILCEKEIETSEKAFLNVIEESYYRSLFDLQKGIGYGFNVSMMNEKIIRTITENVWSGKHYSSRIWFNTTKLSEELTETITSGFMSGKPYKAMAQELQHLSKVGQYAANRLIRTEASYMVNQAELVAYKEAEISKYKFVATLDLKTSKTCQDVDGKIVEVSKGKAGDKENPLPPMHPYCRSFTISYIDDNWLRGAKRRAKNPKTGEYQLVPARMGYAEWKRIYIGDDK